MIIWTKEFILKHKEEIAKHMAVPFRCGGASYVDGQLVYRTGGHFISEITLHSSNCKTSEWWDNWYKNHDHNECIIIENKMTKGVRK